MTALTSFGSLAFASSSACWKPFLVISGDLDSVDRTGGGLGYQIRTVVLTEIGCPCSLEQRVAKRTVEASEVPTLEDGVM